MAKISKNTRVCKQQCFVVGFDRPTMGFNFGEFLLFDVPLQQTKKVLL